MTLQYKHIYTNKYPIKNRLVFNFISHIKKNASAFLLFFGSPKGSGCSVSVSVGWQPLLTGPRLHLMYQEFKNTIVF